MKEFWITVLDKLSRFIVKYIGSVCATVDEQLDSLMSEVDTEQLSRLVSTSPLLVLLELVLMCSMHCKLKENCVFQVLQLRKDQQAAMMASIQSWKQKFKRQAPASTSSSSSLSSTSSQEGEYKERYAAMKSKCDQLQAQVQSMQRTHGAMSERNAELVTLVTQLETQLASVTSDCKQARVHIEQLESKQVLASGDQLDMSSPVRFIASSKVAADENAQLRSTIAAQEKSMASLHAQVASLSQYVSKVRELEDEVEMWKEKGRSADQVERIARKFEAKSSELANALAKVKQVEDQLEAAQKQSADFESVAKQVPQLKSKLDQYKDEIVSLHSKMAETSMKQDSRADGMQELKDKILAYELQVEQHASIVASLEKENESLVQAMRSQRPVMGSKSSSSSLAAQVPTSSSSSSIPSLSSTTGNSKASSEAKSSLGQQLARGVGTGGGKITELEKELASAKDALDSVKLDLEDRLDTMTRLKDKFQSDFVASSEQIRQLKVEKSQLDERVHGLLAENGKLSTTISTLNATITALESNVSALQVGKMELEGVLASTKESFQSAEIAAREEKEQLSAQLKQAQLKCAQSVEEARLLGSESEFVKNELAEARASIESLSAEAASHQDQCVALSHELEEVKHDKSTLSGQLANLEMECETLEETLQDYMDRELAAVESSLSLQNEVQNLTSLVESRDAELTVMQQEMEKAKQSEELITIITALRAQLVAQMKKITMLKEEQRSIIASYHALGMELLQFKIGGIPKPLTTTTTTTYTPSSTSTNQPLSNCSSKSSKTPSKSTPSTRVPLKEKSVNQMPLLGQIPAVPCSDANPKMRRISMAQRALESRPRTSLVAAALAKR